MKKLLIMIMIAFPFFTMAQSTPGFSSKGKTEIYGGMGIFTVPDIASVFGDVLVYALLPGVVKKIDSKSTGTFLVGFDHYAGNRFTIGAQFSYSNYTSNFELQNKSIVTSSTDYYTGMVHGKGVWINKRSFQLYSAVAAGTSVIKATVKGEGKDGRTEFAFQVSPVGFRIGNDFAFFFEAGLGYQGLLSAGFSTRF